MDATLRLLGSPPWGDLGGINPSYYDTLLRRYYPEMVTVEGGTFNMSDSYKVTLSSYQMAKTETTVWQYNLFAVATGKELEAPGWGLWGDNPIVNVNWYDAVEYANWMSKRMDLDTAYAGDLRSDAVKANWEAKGYRLPTDAEWEFAARGGNLEKDKNYTYAGSNDLDEVGWYSADSKSRTQPVAQKKRNALGLYDMSGNVWEWCWDWYAAYQSPLSGDLGGVKNPRGAESGDIRVFRGGSWNNYDEICCVFIRVRYLTSNQLDNFGFRLARYQ